MVAMTMELDRMQLTLDEDTYRSVLKGIDPEAEASNRRWAAFIIADACILLELPRATCATAQVLLHRYYCRVPMSGHDPLVIMTMTCVFLATKIEETRRKIRDILSVFHKLLNSYYGLPDSILDINSNVHLCSCLLACPA
ncbi:hypothetical protein BVRB_023130 [Beta vulgaris subsp. vulgaris]|uniref:Cyclin N-terminal domain-containing protein n=1 Tax=Beta vulgaris subsp. vulgaris TaxID=3555 RepID=A0A0J8B337_BETVV|nr:hypothetical protein BVRB_023130 [Beta vulgaris subsp. vulgaris]